MNLNRFWDEGDDGGVLTLESLHKESIIELFATEKVFMTLSNSVSSEFGTNQ